MLTLRLARNDLNIVVPRTAGFAAEYVHGCFHVRTKLPVGAAELVVVPSCARQMVYLSIPFSHIRGDITGGFLRHITQLAWAPIRDRIAAQFDVAMSRLRMPRDTVHIEQICDDDGEPVGLVTLSLPRLNAWITQQPWAGAWVPRVDEVDFQVDAICVRVALLPKVGV